MFLSTLDRLTNTCSCDMKSCALQESNACIGVCVHTHSVLNGDKLFRFSHDWLTS